MESSLVNTRRRNSSICGEQKLPQTTNINDLIDRFETKNDINLREILLSSKLKHEFELCYQNSQQYDINEELNRIQLYQNQNNDSISSITDSEFCSDDQQRQPQQQQQQQQQRRQKTHYSNRNEKEIFIKNVSPRFGRIFDILSKLPIPRMSVTGMGICFLLAVFIFPRACSENLLFPTFRLLFGTLYPAYASYKAVRTKNVKEYVKWMMYWIVYAFFTCIETFTDIFLSWFPFYYEVKVIIVIWLLSPATKGSSTLYRKFVHPMLTRREQEIDEYINQAKEKGYTAVLQLGSKGVNYATNVIMQTALKGGGNLVQTIRRSYSLSDLSEPDIHRTQDEIDEVIRPQRLLRNRSQTVRSSSGGRPVEMYFSEVDVEAKQPTPNYNYIRSSEDISSGYSSAEPIPISGGLSRTSSMTNASRPRFKAKRAEDEIYIENDEYYEAMRNPNNPIINPSNYVYFQRPNSQIPLLFNRNDVDNDFDIEKMFDQFSDDNSNIDKNASVEKFLIQKKNQMPKPNINLSKKPSEIDEKYEMFCKWLEDNEKYNNLKAKDNKTIISQDSEEFKDTVSTASDDEMFVDVPDTLKIESKVILNDQSNDLSNDQSNDLTNDQSNGKTNNSIEDSSNKSSTRDQEILEEKQNEIVISNDQSEIKLPTFAKVLIETSNEISDTSINLLEEKPFTKSVLSLKSIVDDENISTNNSKRPVAHNKGKAPEPPEIENRESISPDKSLPQMLTEYSEFTKYVLGELKATSSTKPSIPSVSNNSSINDSSINNSSANDSPVNNSFVNDSKTPMKPCDEPSQSQLIVPVVQMQSPPEKCPPSRSQSPKPPEVKKSKKSIFKNYLPSLFRYDSPKPDSNDEYPKETRI